MLLQINAVKPPRMAPSKSDFVIEPPKRSADYAATRRILLRTPGLGKLFWRTFSVLRDAENTVVRIFEPRDLVAAGRGPNAEFLILSERIFLEGDAAIFQPVCDRSDVFHFPAEDGALKRGKVRDFCDANLVAADAHDQCKLIEADEFATKFAFVESARFVIVLCGDEADHFACSQHFRLPRRLRVQKYHLRGFVSLAIVTTNVA